MGPESRFWERDAYIVSQIEKIRASQWPYAARDLMEWGKQIKPPKTPEQRAHLNIVCEIVAGAIKASPPILLNNVFGTEEDGFKALERQLAAYPKPYPPLVTALRQALKANEYLR